jgi:hypothetical protein
MNEYTYERAYARNRHMIERVNERTNDDCVNVITSCANLYYDASRVEIEQYTDELHVFVRRRNSSRRDFVASYHAT